MAETTSPLKPASPPSPAALLARLHRVNPYRGFDFKAYPYDERGWNFNSPIFGELISELRPMLIVEVGSWKGGSALVMAQVLRNIQLSTAILCVDTWLGALEFWTDHDDEERYGSLRLRHGYPTVYYQFLANVCHRGFTDVIVPFPQTSATAALWLAREHIVADLIYVDASHEYADVDADVRTYWACLRPGGVMFGDDFTDNWPGVKKAVLEFAYANGAALEVRDNNFWILRKPTRAPVAIAPAPAAASERDTMLERLWEEVCAHITCECRLQPTRPVWLWGAGGAGRRVFSHLQSQGIAVAGFIDRKAPPEGTFHEKPLLSPANFAAHHRTANGAKALVVITSMYHLEITPQLAALGLADGVDYFRTL